ncbi:MAG TPA: tetratricopeptide repeat protein [Flavobacteriales bacterium]|nr:tetratricopeptide repeat protein [Flavobacteriales bacterium]
MTAGLSEILQSEQAVNGPIVAGFRAVLRLRLLLLVLAISMADQALPQSATLSGRIVFQNSGLAPAVGVLVKASDANATRSTSAGAFTLRFATKLPGERADIAVGDTAHGSRPIEVVNTDVLAAARVPLATEEAMTITVCDKGELRAAKLRYAGLLEAENEEIYRLAVGENDRLRAQKDLSRAELDRLTLERDSIERKYALVSQQLDTMAAYLARLNLDLCSDLVRNAVRQLESKAGLEAVLHILSNEQLDAALHDAEQAEEKARERFRQLLSAYRIKYDLLLTAYKLDSARACAYKAWEIHRKHLGEDTLGLIRRLRSLSEIEKRMGHYQAALDHLRTAHSYCPIRHAAWDEVRAVLLTEQGQVLAGIGRYYEADSLLQMAIAVVDASDSIDASERACIQFLRGDILAQNKEFEQAKVLFETIAKDTAVHWTGYPRVYLSLMRALAIVEAEIGELEKARDMLRQVIIIWETYTKSAPGEELAQCYMDAAGVHYRLREYRLAEAYTRKAFHMRLKISGPDHPELAGAQQAYAALLFHQGRPMEAKPHMEEAMRLSMLNRVPAHPEVLQAKMNLAAVCQGLDELDQADELCSDIQGYDEILWDDIRTTIRSIETNISIQRGEYDAALNSLFKALDLTTNKVSLAEIHKDIAEVHRCAGNKRAAITHERRALDLELNVVEQLDTAAGSGMYYSMAKRYAALNNFNEAIKAARTALTLDTADQGLDHSELVADHDLLAQLYATAGKDSKAIRHAHAALTIEEDAHSGPSRHVVDAQLRLALILRNAEGYSRAADSLSHQAWNTGSDLYRPGEAKFALLAIRAASCGRWNSRDVQMLHQLADSLKGLAHLDALQELEYEKYAIDLVVQSERCQEAESRALNLLRKIKQRYPKDHMQFVDCYGQLQKIYRCLDNMRKYHYYRKKKSETLKRGYKEEYISF